MRRLRAAIAAPLLPTCVAGGDDSEGAPSTSEHDNEYTTGSGRAEHGVATLIRGVVCWRDPPGRIQQRLFRLFGHHAVAIDVLDVCFVPIEHALRTMVASHGPPDGRMQIPLATSAVAAVGLFGGIAAAAAALVRWR